MKKQTLIKVAICIYLIALIGYTVTSPRMERWKNRIENVHKVR